MCGICGAINLRGDPIPDLAGSLEVMSDLIAHRGPDDDGVWVHERGHVGFGHRRLSVIDPTPAGHQPMTDPAGRWITYNGEVYNYPELRTELGGSFRTGCDTEVVLRAHNRWGAESLDRLRGMFAYALWDEPEHELLCARDRFGIKPFYYAQVGDVLLLRLGGKGATSLPSGHPNRRGGPSRLPDVPALPRGQDPLRGSARAASGNRLRVRNGVIRTERYWEVYYDLDFDHTAHHFEEQIERLLSESVSLHLRSDVPVGGLPQRRPGLERGGRSGELGVRRSPEGLHGTFPGGRAL